MTGNVRFFIKKNKSKTLSFGGGGYLTCDARAALD